MNLKLKNTNVHHIIVSMGIFLMIKVFFSKFLHKDQYTLIMYGLLFGFEILLSILCTPIKGKDTL